MRVEARARGEIDASPTAASGRVFDQETGRGIEGALVQLRTRGFGSPTTPDDAGEPLTAIADANGAWSIARIRPGRHVLTASASGHLPGERTDLDLRPRQPNTGLDLGLERGGHPLRGTVSDVSGGPIDGAVISIEGDRGRNMIDFGRVVYPAVTDAEGRFVVQVRDGVYEVDAWHPDYTGDSQTADVAGGPRSVALRLIPAGMIEGIVRAAEGGAPVAGAIVSHGDGAEFGGEMAKTDEAGRFRLGRLRPGPHELTAAAAGHASSEPLKVELGIGESLSGVEIRVDRAYKISGFVVSKDDPKRSLAGVLVAAYSLDPMRLQPATAPSEVDGYFEIFGVKPGTYSLGSIAEEALPEVLGGPSVSVDSNDVTNVVVQLDRGVELRGRVEPAALASISLTLANEDPGFLDMISNIGNMFVRSQSDRRGDFVLRPVKPGMLRVIAEAPDGSRGHLDVEVGTRGLDGVVVTLEPRATATGRVVDLRGAPLRSGSVEYLPRQQQEDEGMSSPLSESRSRERASIGEDGTYVLRGLDGGEYNVRVLDRAGNVVRWADTGERTYEPVRKTIAAAVVNPGLDYTVELRDGVLRGIVVGPDGGPLLDAWVTATPEQSSDAESRSHRPAQAQPAERVGVVPQPPKADAPVGVVNDSTDLGPGRGEPALTDGSGRFVLNGLARRTYTLKVEALKGSARATLARVAPGSEVRVQVMPLAELAGRVYAGGLPAKRYELRVEGKLGGLRRATEMIDSPDGAFQFDHLDPGTYRLIASADEGHVESEFELKPGERQQVRLELLPWARLRGVVIDGQTGAPISGMSVTVYQRDSFQNGALFDMLLGKGPHTDTSGRFEVPHLAAGKSTLEVFDGDLLTQRIVARVEVEVEAGADRDLGTIHGVTLAKVPKDERGQLGLRLLTTTELARPRPPGTKVEPLAQPEDAGAVRHVYVLAVTINGPADRAGLQPGDRVLTINGTAVATLGTDNAERLLEPGNIRRGENFTLEFERDSNRQSIAVEADSSRPDP